MFAAIIQRASLKYGIPVSWIQSVIETESAWDQRAYREEPRIGDASYGLMQLLTSTARNLGYTGTDDGLFDPTTNIEYGTRLLRELRDRYGDDVRRIYSAYNSGNPDAWNLSGEVRNNVARFMNIYTRYSKPASSVILLCVVGFLLWKWL